MPTDTIEIPLTQGKVAIIDASDYELVRRYKWYASYHPDGNRWSARTTLYTPGRGCRALYMHHLIFSRKPVDHINRDPLDNRRSNLRDGPPTLQAVNKRPYKGKRFKGVCWHRRNGKWCARIRVSGQLVGLGFYACEEEAARAYNRAALKAWGSLAVLNPV